MRAPPDEPRTVLQRNGTEPPRRWLTETAFAAGALAVLLLMWFQWDVAEQITPFLMPGYYLLIADLVLAMIAASAVQAIMRRKSVRLPRLLAPPLITAALVAALLTVPFTDLYL